MTETSKGIIKAFVGGASDGKSGAGGLAIDGRCLLSDGNYFGDYVAIAERPSSDGVWKIIDAEGLPDRIAAHVGLVASSVPEDAPVERVPYKALNRAA